MSEGIVGSVGLDDLRADMSGRDLAIIGQVADLRLMTGRQIEAVHFPAGEHETATAAARAARRCLERLARHRILVRLDRRIGGVRAGSRSFVYALGPVGVALVGLDDLGAALRGRATASPPSSSSSTPWRSVNSSST